MGGLGSPFFLGGKCAGGGEVRGRVHVGKVEDIDVPTKVKYLIANP